MTDTGEREVTIFVEGDTAEYRGRVTGHGDIVVAGDLVTVCRANEDEYTDVWVIRNGCDHLVPIPVSAVDLEWIGSAGLTEE
jgi:hypothetical protein